MLIDSHCHLNFDQFKNDLPAVLHRAAEAGVTAFINPSVDMTTTHQVLDLAAGIPNLYAAIGFHPNDAASFTDDTLAELRELAKKPKVVSIGEIGLDYYWDEAPRPVQQRVFEQQLELAQELNLPVIIHQRESAADTMAVLRSWLAGNQPPNGSVDSQNGAMNHPGLVLHSFSGDVAMAEEAVELGFHIGISGPVTFKNARDLPAVVAATPLSRLLVETDAPFLSPHPFRGKRNEPARVKLVAQKVADIKGQPFPDISQQLTTNTITLFNLTL